MFSQDQINEVISPVFSSHPDHAFQCTGNIKRTAFRHVD